LRYVQKPWGAEFIWAETPRYAGKILRILDGHSLSLQKHALKDETLMLISGTATLEVDGEIKEMLPDISWRIKPGTIHRIHAQEYSEILEVSSPELNDTERLEDRYGRLDD
jgi:mannose-6-phosphate isomerase-like protein (cupin superfamily)